MHIRINIPAWSRREIGAGLAPSVWFGRQGDKERDLLTAAMSSTFDGWSVQPLASGRSAIACAVRALGLRGGRIAVPAYVCPAVVAGLGAAPATAVPIDCSESSTRFDRALLADAVRSGSIDAVLAANTYGIDQDLPWLATVGLPVIEDAAYQVGRIAPDGRPCGTRANAGVLSFNFKTLTGVGGGVLLTRERLNVETPRASDRIGERVRFVNYAARAVLRHRIPAFLPGAEAPPANSANAPRHDRAPVACGAMSELQAAVAYIQWQRRIELINAQTRNAKAVVEAVSVAGEAVPMIGAGAASHLVPALAKSASDAHRLRVALHKCGVQTENPYPMIWDGGQSFPNAESIARRLVLIPCNASLDASQIERISRAIRDAARGTAFVGSRGAPTEAVSR